MNVVFNYLNIRKLGIVVACVALVLDFVSKTYVLEHYDLWPMQVLPNFFWLVLAWNKGVSFSFMHDVQTPLVVFGQPVGPELWVPVMLGGLALVACVWFVHWMGERPCSWRHLSRSLGLHQVGLGLVVGGALGNVLDRVQHGAVVDFLLFKPLSFLGVQGFFPAFNVADACISVGVVLLFVDGWIQHRKSLRQQKKEAARGPEKNQRKK
jgi:signal peptidase II